MCIRDRDGILPTLGRHALAQQRSDAAALGAAADDFASGGYALWAGEAAAEASRLYRAAGDLPAARAMDAVVLGAVRSCGPAAAHLAVTGADRLTPREVEVALLAAKGRSDRDIAAALGVSIRTVQAHLRSVFQKLDLTSRTSLADALGLLWEPAAPTAHPR